MAQLSQLLARLPEGKDVHMSTMGHVLWVCWHNNLTPAVNQTLLNYGGMLVGEEREQALVLLHRRRFSGPGPADGLGQFQ